MRVKSDERKKSKDEEGGRERENEMLSPTCPG